MATIIRGFVREGKIIPEQPLPEGAAVEITLAGQQPPVPADLQEELDAWALGSTQALELVERMADEGASGANG